MELLIPIAAVLGLALLCESLTEYFFAPLLAKFRINKGYLRYISALVGVGLCLLYGVDALSGLLDLSPRFAPLGEVLTGLVLGRGANYVHDFYTRWLSLRAPPR